MAPIYDKNSCSTAPQSRCFYYYAINTNLGGDPSWYSNPLGYQITTDVLGVYFCSAYASGANNGINAYANAIGINGASDIWYNSTPISIGGLLSYYGYASDANNYNFIFTNTLGSPVVSGWVQGASCSLRCFEHPFQKPDLSVAIVQLDSFNNISNMYAPTGASPITLDLLNPADVANFQTLLQNIFGPQASVNAAYPPSGNVILTISNVYTDQITFYMALGAVHTMTEITC